MESSGSPARRRHAGPCTGGEAAIGTIVYGGILYGVYLAVNRK